MRIVKAWILNLGRLVVALPLVIGSFVPGAAQEVETDTSDTQIIHIDAARIFEGKTIDSVHYQFLYGNVELTHGDIHMYCDSAVIIDESQVKAYGNVIIQRSDTLVIFADTLDYRADSLEAVLTGEVVLNSGTDQLWTTRLFYDLDHDLAYYDKSAVMVNDSTQISSNVGLFWVGSSLAKLTDSVVVIGDEVTLLTDSMYYKTSTQWAEFIAPTWIIQEGSRIYCESGYYDVPGRNAVFSQNARYTKGTEIATADTIAYDGSQELVRMIGNAHYQDGNQVIDSDEIRFYDETGDVEIIGNATYRDSIRTVQAPIILYNERTEVIRTQGRSNLVENAQDLEADNLDFDQTTGLGVVWGDVIFTDTSANTIVHADTAFYDRNANSVLAYGSKRSLLKSLMEGDTLFMTSDTLFFAKEADTITLDTFQRFKAYMDVRILKGTLQGLCDSVIFDSRDSIITMYGDPILWSDTTQFTADTIDILLRNDAIEEVRLIGRGLIINIVNGMFFNQIKGKHVTARLENDEVKDVLVVGNAESIYYVQDEDDAYIGVNRVAASEILFTFESKQLGGIRLFSQPDGALKPMDQVDHGALRLEGFVWRNEERPLTFAELF